MAKLQVFSVYDKAVSAFMRPFYQLTNAGAIRDFEDACAQKDSPFAKHPGDFTLYVIGEFDESSGDIIAIDPKRIIGALECVAQSATLVDNGASPVPRL